MKTLGKNQKKILELLQTHRDGMTYRDLSKRLHSSSDDFHTNQVRYTVNSLRKRGYPVYLTEYNGLVIIAEEKKDFKVVHERWSDMLDSKHEAYSRVIAQVYEKQPSMIPEIKLRLNSLQRQLMAFEDENYRQQLISTPDESITVNTNK